MSAGSIATAYVEIAPTTKGIAGKLGKALGGEADSAGKSSGESLASSLISTLKTAVVAAGVGKMIGEAFTQGAALQQSLGGVETLFKDSAETIKFYASEAYKTTGLSANEYMENVTGFSAGLIASMGGNTTEAAKIANMAMIDMADNANKMGTDMSSIQTAYQGFAKQNYTMLDNLKLGYGGTKKEMERLLQDAQKISGVEYNINNLDDVYSAIHVIQEDLDITGTTAKEASSTFSGSFASMKASAQNLLGYMATGGNIHQALLQLADTAGTFIFGNAIPMMFQLVSAVPEVITMAVQTGIPKLLEQGSGILEAFKENVWNRLPELAETGYNMVQNLLTGVENKLPELINTGLSMVRNLATGVANNLPMIVEKAGELMERFAGMIGQNLPNILVKGTYILITLIKGILQVIPQLPEIAYNCIHSFSQAWDSYNWSSIGTHLMNGLVNGIKNGIGKVVEAAKSAAKSAFDAAKNFLGIKSPSRLFRDEVGKNIALGTAVGIEQNVGSVYKAVKLMQLGAKKLNNSAYDFDVRGGISSQTLTALTTLANSNTQIILDSGELVGMTVSKYDKALGKRAYKAQMGVVRGI